MTGPTRILDVTATRLAHNPVVVPGMDERIGCNINGPSLVRAPEWLAGAPGRYLLYFAHHEGTFIRLAFADSLDGPWRIHGPGVLDVADCHFTDHLASPDVHIDHERRQVRMYYHGLIGQLDLGKVQGTRVAVSSDGTRFEALPTLLMPRPYLRTFDWDGMVYGLTMSGVFWRSPDGLRPFDHMPWPSAALPAFWEGLELDRLGRWPGPLPFRCRHTAVHRVGSQLLVIYSMADETPERLVYSIVDLDGPWEHWRGTPPRELLEPVHGWEGADLPLARSSFGAVHDRVRELRDPAVFQDTDGSCYVLYSVAGERGIAIARLDIEVSAGGLAP